MSIPIATERSLLSHDEFEAVRVTHYPFLLDLSRDALQNVQKDLRQRRDKERAVTRRGRRARQENSGTREISPDGEHRPSAKRKQVFAQALKRVNHENQRLVAATEREKMVESAQQALELRRARRVARHPSSGRVDRAGMKAKPSRRRTPGVSGAEVGRASQATKANQAKRDSRKRAG